MKNTEFGAAHVYEKMTGVWEFELESLLIESLLDQVKQLKKDIAEMLTEEEKKNETNHFQINHRADRLPRE